MFCISVGFNKDTAKIAEWFCVSAGFNNKPYPPTPKEAKTLGKIFGLSKPVVESCAERVINAANQWKELAHKNDVDEMQIKTLSHIIKKSLK